METLCERNRTVLGLGESLDNRKTRPRGYKNFLMLNSAESQIINIGKFFLA